MKCKTYSDQELKDARKGGYKTSKPSKPKNKTVTMLENYIIRYNKWVDNVKDRAKDYRAGLTKKQSESKKLKSLKEQVSKI